MTKFLKQALFVIPVVAIVAAPVALHLKNKPNPVTASGLNTPGIPNFFKTPQNSNQSYSMPEPFANENIFAMSYSMRKSMDPNTWMQMMTNMMNPHGAPAEAICASCHEVDDLARYQKQFGPILQSMWGPYQTMMDPHTMGQMMNPALMTQMMHQMMTMPMQMMMPVNQGISMNPFFMHPQSTIQSPMKPEEYEKWYNEQRSESK